MGATPVFVDVVTKAACISAGTIKLIISPRTKQSFRCTWPLACDIRDHGARPNATASMSSGIVLKRTARRSTVHRFKALAMPAAPHFAETDHLDRRRRVRKLRNSTGEMGLVLFSKDHGGNWDKIISPPIQRVFVGCMTAWVPVAVDGTAGSHQAAAIAESSTTALRARNAGTYGRLRLMMCRGCACRCRRGNSPCLLKLYAYVDVPDGGKSCAAILQRAGEAGPGFPGSCSNLS